jgi:hypothetical protein
LILAVLASAVWAGEREHRDAWCLDRGGRAEVRLADGTRCDCVTSTHAVEFDFGPSWYSAVGQALHYGRMTGKRSGIVLILRNGDGRYLERLRAVVSEFDLPLDVWALDISKSAE